MRIANLAALHLFSASTLLPVTVFANGAEPSRRGPPSLLTVGSDAACDHSTLQAALDFTQSNGPGNDIIRIATNHNDISVSAEIFAQSVILQGGFSSCSTFASSGRTTIDGSGGSVGSVFLIHGGSAVDQHDVVMRDLTIRGGEDDGFGGGLDISGGMNVRLERTVVENNESAFGGGIAIHNTPFVASLVIADGSQILSNTATQNGGGVYCENGFADLFDGAIAFNQANLGGGVNAQGCMFRQEAGGPLLGILSNSALIGGGIAAGNSTVELTGTSTALASIVSNSAGAIGGGIWVVFTEVRAKNTAINDNSADSAGGGAFVGLGGRFFMDRLTGKACTVPGGRCSTLSGNVADRGGGLFVESGSELADVRRTYFRNTAALEGSAVFVTGSARLVMEGVVLAVNQGGDSVIKLQGEASGLLAFVTMTANNASEALIVARDDTFAAATSLEIYSSIFWELAGTGILSFDASDSIAVACLLVHESGSLPAGTSVSIGDPLFANPGDGDYHLTQSSPAVDYCDAAAYSPTHRDIDGQDRGRDHLQVPDNFPLSWFDIGADELPFPPIFSDGFESGNTSEWSSSSL